jgi:hypothetical protein
MDRLASVLRDEDGKSDTFNYYLDGEMSGAHYANNARNVTYTIDNAGNRTSVTDGTVKTYVPNNINLYSTVGARRSPTATGTPLRPTMGKAMIPLRARNSAR